MTAAEFAQLGDEIDAVITLWVERTRDRRDAELADVEVQWYSYPVGDPPAEAAPASESQSGDQNK